MLPLLAAIAVTAPTLTIDLDRSLVGAFNRDGFIVSGVYPATLRGDRLRLPNGNGGLFLHAGAHRLTLDRFQFAPGARLRAHVGNQSVTLAHGRGARFTFTAAGARALRVQLHTARPVAGAPLGRVSATRPR